MNWEPPKTVATFKINENEQAEADKWIGRHECKKSKKSAEINQRVVSPVSPFSYKFTPTSIGHLVYVVCVCGASHDITDVSCW